MERLMPGKLPLEDAPSHCSQTCPPRTYGLGARRGRLPLPDGPGRRQGRARGVSALLRGFQLQRGLFRGLLAGFVLSQPSADRPHSHAKRPFFKNRQRPRRPRTGSGSSPNSPRGGLGRVLLLRIHQRGLCPPRLQARGSGARNGRGSLHRLPADLGWDTPRRLRFQRRGGGSCRVSPRPASWAARPASPCAPASGRARVSPRPTAARAAGRP